VKLQMPMPTSFKFETTNGQYVVLPLTAVVDMYTESFNYRITAAYSARNRHPGHDWIVAVTLPWDADLSKAKLIIADVEPELRNRGFEFDGFCVGNPKGECIVVAPDQYSEIYTALDVLFSVKRERWPFPWVRSDDENPEKKQLTYNGRDITIRAYSDGAYR